jgi:hypothetical protein
VPLATKTAVASAILDHLQRMRSRAASGAAGGA